LKDYQTLLSQLEHAFNTSPQFSLQKLWFYVHPTIHTLSLIYQLIQELEDHSSSLSSDEGSSDEEDPEEAARNEALGLGGAKLKAVLSEFGKGDSSGIYVKGGEVLTVIFERMQHMAGDPTAHAIYSSLLRAAGKPYVEMLTTWVTTGNLVDPYEELLVKESKFIDRGILEMDYTDEYWERRYTVSICVLLVVILCSTTAASRWIDLFRVETTSSGSASSKNPRREATWRGVHTSLARGLETQDPTGREISQRDTRMRY
jgi:gamma-tubulin complex component 2